MELYTVSRWRILIHYITHAVIKINFVIFTLNKMFHIVALNTPRSRVLLKHIVRHRSSSHYLLRANPLVPSGPLGCLNILSESVFETGKSLGTSW